MITIIFNLFQSSSYLYICCVFASKTLQWNLVSKGSFTFVYSMNLIYDLVSWCVMPVSVGYHLFEEKYSLSFLFEVIAYWKFHWMLIWEGVIRFNPKHPSLPAVIKNWKFVLFHNTAKPTLSLHYWSDLFDKRTEHNPNCCHHSIHLMPCWDA